MEAALVARISCIQRIYLLRGGMAAAKGHCVSVPAAMKIATRLPLLPKEVDIFVLKRRTAKDELRAYTVRRHVVEAALRGLCCGAQGGETKEEVGTVNRRHCLHGVTRVRAWVSATPGAPLPTTTRWSAPPTTAASCCTNGGSLSCGVVCACSH